MSKEVVVSRSDLPLSDERRTSKRNYFPFTSSRVDRPFLWSRFCRFEVTKWAKPEKKKMAKDADVRRNIHSFSVFILSRKKKRDKNKNYLFRDLWLSARHWMVELRVTVSYKRPAGTREHQTALRLFLCERTVTNVCRSIDSLTTNKAVKTTDLWPFVSNFTSHSHS